MFLGVVKNQNQGNFIELIKLLASYFENVNTMVSQNTSWNIYKALRFVDKNVFIINDCFFFFDIIHVDTSASSLKEKNVMFFHIIILLFMTLEVKDTMTQIICEVNITGCKLCSLTVII